MQRWTDHTRAAVHHELDSSLTTLPRSALSLVLTDFPDVGHMPVLDKTNVVILAGTPHPKESAVGERLDGVFGTSSCKKYWCKALALLGSEAAITTALQEQRLVILQTCPLSLVKPSAPKGTVQHYKLKTAMDNLAAKASYASEDKALDVLLDLAKGDRHVVFVHLVGTAYWRKAKFWSVAEGKGRLIHRRRGTFAFKCSLGWPNFSIVQSAVIRRALAPRPAISAAARRTAAAAAANAGRVSSSAAAAANAGGVGSSAAAAAAANAGGASSSAAAAAAASAGGASSSAAAAAANAGAASTSAAAANAGAASSSAAAAAAAGNLVAPPAAIAVYNAMVTSVTNRKRTSPTDGAVNTSEPSTPSAATAAAVAADADGDTHERKRPRSSVEASGTPHGIDKLNPVTINHNEQAVPPDTADNMTAVADDDGANVEDKEMDQLAYASAKKILAECIGSVDRTSSLLNDFKDVLDADERSLCQALIDSCKGVLADAEGKQQRLLDIAEDGEDTLSKLVCIHGALADFCDIVEGRVKQAGTQLKVGVMSVCVDVGRRMLDEYEQKFSSLKELESAVGALRRNFGVDLQVPDSILEHRIATTATVAADECRSILSQPNAHGSHQILVAVQKLQAAVTELSSFVQQLSQKACECSRIVLRK